MSERRVNRRRAFVATCALVLVVGVSCALFAFAAGAYGIAFQLAAPAAACGFALIVCDELGWSA